MYPQTTDPTAQFACSCCTLCCNQPWNTHIEPDKAERLDAHDFSAYPHLADRPRYDASGTNRKDLYRIPKRDGTRCLYLDDDGLCIIHKELGPEAKPDMCLQFPYMVARTWTEDRVSVNYGCPAVQTSRGLPLSDQLDDIAALVPRTQREPNHDAPVPLDASTRLTKPETDALFARAIALFDDNAPGDVWTRLAELLGLLVAVGSAKENGSIPNADGELADLLRSGRPLPNMPDVPAIHAFPSADQAPPQARFLFAATLYPDTVPVDAATSLGLFRRLTLVPKLMALATLKGTYASRLLGRNVSVEEVLAHEVGDELDDSATRLLLRYFRSRLWQRFPAGTRLSILAGVHQHILDFAAIVFLARAEALHLGKSCLDGSVVTRALTAVEFHLANQKRLFDQTMKRWARRQLQRPELAWASLRLMALKQGEVSARQVNEST